MAQPPPPLRKADTVESFVTGRMIRARKFGWSMMADIKRSLLDVSPAAHNSCDDEEFLEDHSVEKVETWEEFFGRHTRNVMHFLVEDWCLSAMLGIITAVLSVGQDVAIEQLQHLHVLTYDYTVTISPYLAFAAWVLHISLLVAAAAIFCQIVSPQAVGSGIPELKVILHGFNMKNYLTFRTLIAKMGGLTLAMGSGLPIGKEGPFVHMGAIVATLLSRLTAACQYSAFFSNEGREVELLSTGCAVGIACTFSAPVGAVLYAIESTSKYFAVKNYWRAFLASTCSAIVFRFANFFVTDAQSGTITAFYQTSFPTSVFFIEELPIFMLLGFICGIAASLFIFTHRHVTLFRQHNRVFKLIFRNNFLAFTVFMAFMVGVITFPLGFGRYIAGKLTFRETMADFFNNCTWSVVSNTSNRACDVRLLQHWTGGPDGGLSIYTTLACYTVVYFFLVSICISLNVPSGVFVPSFILGAAMGRLMGEAMGEWYPDGFRGLAGHQIYPGLYAVVGAAAYTGAVTHTVSVAVIICELTGQLSPILPVLIAMLVSNAICKFLQPSIYESIIRIKKYPYLPDLPPSRVSVHTVKVEQVMVKDVIYIHQHTTYRELREILRFAPSLRALPVVTDPKNKILLGSVAKRYLVHLLRRHVIEETLNGLDTGKSGRRTPSELFNSFRRSTKKQTIKRQLSARSTTSETSDRSAGDRRSLMNDRTFTGNTLLAISPLHAPNVLPLCAVFTEPTTAELKAKANADPETLLDRKIDLEEIAIDAAPFQLVLGSSLYKVHSLFSLLGLSHAYVTDCGRLIGVMGLKELRNALANIYVRGAVPVKIDRKLTSASYFLPKMMEEHWEEQQQRAAEAMADSADHLHFTARRNTITSEEGTQTAPYAATLQIPQITIDM